MTFKMNWYDFKNNRFQYGGDVFDMYRLNRPNPIKTRIIFLLNVHRGQWVRTSDIIEFMYSETNPDNWPEHQLNVLSVTICNIRRILPDGVRVVSSNSFRYMLDVETPHPKTGRTH